MSLFSEVSMSLVGFIAAVSTAAGTGWFAGRRTKFLKFRKRVLSLENEMLANHATILSLEKKLSDIQSHRENGVVNRNGYTERQNGHTNGHAVHNNGHTIKKNGHM